MLTTKRKKSFLTIAEVYFTADPSQVSEDADIIIYLQAAQKGNKYVPFNTLHIDLQKPEEELYAQITKNTQYEISRAEKKDALIAAAGMPTEKDITCFCTFFDDFAKDKGLSPANRTKLQVLNQHQALVISEVRDENQQNLCYHTYITDGNRARLLYSASHFRKIVQTETRALIGRANRYLHWFDIRYFKHQGYKIYDMGGLSLSKEDDALARIDSFKKSFGGTVVTEYNVYQAKTFMGKLALKYLKI